MYLIDLFIVPNIPPQVNMTATSGQGEITASMPSSEQAVTQSHQCIEGSCMYNYIIICMLQQYNILTF